MPTWAHLFNYLQNRFTDVSFFLDMYFFFLFFFLFYALNIFFVVYHFINYLLSHLGNIGPRSTQGQNSSTWPLRLPRKRLIYISLLWFFSPKPCLLGTEFKYLVQLSHSDLCKLYQVYLRYHFVTVKIKLT